MRAWSVPEPARVPGRPPPLRLYDTATRELRATAPGETATMYVCGITPYDAAHLGHAATYLAFDLVGRQWRDAGHRVRYVQNVTDVDDPLLERAKALGADWVDLAERETQVFRDDMTALRVLPPDAYVGAVEAMPVIAAFLERLRERGATYDLEGDLYFPVSVAPRFGEVTGLDRATMLALARERGGDPDRPGKKDPLDPLLWLAARPGEPSWPSPFGIGRPGWHVECAAIAVDRLGPTIDLQGGGRDLAFPHHEMSAAHAEVGTACWPFARHYVHTGMVALDGEKMSKSKGNLVFASRLRADDVDPMAIRLGLLAHHYRSNWEWVPAVLAEATARLGRWREAFAAGTAPSAEPVVTRIRERLADDLDAPAAIAAVDRWAEATRVPGGRDHDAPATVAAAVDALLGVG